jgi:hypothetical protein
MSKNLLDHQDVIYEKKLVDQFVRELACEKMKRFTASYISEKIGVDVDFIKERLLQLSNDDQLIINFEVICPHKCTYKIVERHSNLNNVPIGEFAKCECGNEFIVGIEDVYITFSPNEKYYDYEIVKR